MLTDGSEDLAAPRWTRSPAIRWIAFSLVLTGLAAVFVPDFVRVDDEITAEVGSPARAQRTFPTRGTPELSATMDSDAGASDFASIAQPIQSYPLARSIATDAPATPTSDLPFGLLSQPESEESKSNRLPSPLGSASTGFDCVIEPSDIVSVGSALFAIVEAVPVERSDFVEADQIVARLESDVESAAVRVAHKRATMNGDVEAREASLALSQQRRIRADRLFGHNVVSVDALDESIADASLARAELQQAREIKELMKLELDEARERLERRTIRSPISGVVVERLKSPGEIVKEEAILTIAQIDPLHVEAILPGALFGSVERGMRAEVRPELPDVGTQIATVRIVDRVIDPRSGTFGVSLEIPNSDGAIPSGLHCQVRFLPGE
ncbi:MAG: efflux RND transporter periplasmic adaptor subunit [Deltaproteobacteria bacterium]|nr:efflux RND transporter periplasmic adaptor subunit [Deltaproteobacteria bacterium]